MQAQIERVEGDTLSLNFPGLPAEMDADYDRWALDVAEFESFTKETYAWRSAMINASTKDLIIDCND